MRSMRSSAASDVQPPENIVDTDTSVNTTSTDSNGGEGKEDVPVDVEAGISQKHGILWMYYDDDGLSHCNDPWSPCHAGLSSEIEAAYQRNPVATVIVNSDKWRYQVDLGSMTQTNLDHPSHRCRSLRRLELS